MAHIDHHPAGSFCWIELATTDQNAAKSFYSSSFGWDPQDSPMGPDEFYTMFRLEGRDAAAGYTLRPEQRAQGVPPHWMPYIAVDNADQAVDKAEAAWRHSTGSGIRCHGPRSHGRAPGSHRGALLRLASQEEYWAGHRARPRHALLGRPEHARSQARRDFYSGLFGWQLILDPKDPSGYLHIKNGEHFIGGIPPATHRQPGEPAHWLAYFAVDDVDASAHQAKQMGAKLFLSPMTMEGVGRMAVIADPQGAVFAIFKSARE